MYYEKLKFSRMSYILRYPDGYQAGEHYPVLIFLHGAGTRGNNLNQLLNNPFFHEIAGWPEFPFIVAAPQCSENSWFDMFETLKQFVLTVSQQEYALKQKIYLMGASMGGYAAWQLAMSLPQVFAAIVPICGGGMYWNAGRLKGVPVWAFHGRKDSVVSVEESQKMVDAVVRNGGQAKLTVYEENGHDAWSDTYRNWEVFQWLLSKENTELVEVTDFYKNSDIYG